ncbi:hypothetical protein OIU76_027658 [Salix suchowensis]|nr:hypothetical protein OIU76_027658 [Salix suchowensis]
MQRCIATAVTTPFESGCRAKAVEGRIHQTLDGSAERLANDSTGGSSSDASPPKGFAASENSRQNNVIEIFNNPRIHDEFMGVGEYRNLVLPNGKFGLGFRRFSSSDGSFYGFGHSGLGGSTGFCDIKNRFAIAVTLNKMSFGTATRRIIQS